MSAAPRRRRATAPRDQSGLTYVETLVAVAVVAASLAPMAEAMRNGIAATGVHRTEATERQRLATRLEEVLANRFDVLDAEAVATGNGLSPTYSDAVGAPGRILVTVSRYDRNGSTTADSGLLHVQASIGNSPLTLASLRSR